MTIDEGLRFDDERPSVTQDSRARAIRRRRNTFRSYPAPTEPMSRSSAAWIAASRHVREPTAELLPVVDWFHSESEARERFRWALRDSLDELLDGQRTGRWAYQQLTKTEKTYLGTAVEVNLTKEFGIENGVDLDWRIAGIDIDCKFSKDLGGWEIPMEMYVCADHGARSGKADHPALLAWMNDDTSQWAAGLVTITDNRLRWRADPDTGESVRGYNRDNKRRLAESSAADIYWLWGGIQSDLPRNLIRHLSTGSRERIFSWPDSGQKRVDFLFRQVQCRIVGRQTVLTVAQQDDAPKRARDARLHLRGEGILVLGHQGSHPHVARALKLAVPVKGEWIAVRVVPVNANDPRPAFTLDGERWGRADETEAATPAPDLPPTRQIDG